MNQTETYGLSQWDKTDRIQMEDFNADNAKIDAALAAVAAGGLKIITGSFSGTGSTGTRTYTLGFKPKLLLLRTSYMNSNYAHYKGLLMTENLIIAFHTSGDTYMMDPHSDYAITSDGFQINHRNLALDNSGTTLYYWALY